MAFWDKLRGELIDIIEWLDSTDDTMVYRFERHNNEIKHGAQLIVREGQAAVFINEGQLADVFQPGTYTLITENVPILSTLQGWKHGFESPFKAEVYFCSTRRFTDLKWGTKNPIMLRDPEFGPVRLRAFGTYVVRIDEPASFIREIVGTDGNFTTDGITSQLRNMIVARFSDILGESGIPVLDLAGNYDELGEFVTNRLQAEFKTYGIEVSQLLVENISLPPAVEEALDKRSSMGVIGNLRNYTQFQAAEALRDAAQNPGGGSAGAGMGMGMGFAMGNQMAQAMGAAQPPQGGDAGASQPGAGAGAATPPPLPGQGVSFWAAINNQQAGPFDLNALGQMVQQGQLTRETLVWQEGMANWTAAGEVVALQPLFSATPPPLPPQE
jgi:membrane protease subunit (stomatin/prohibitin family)